MNNLVDLHTHTLFSKHAYSSLTENIDHASSLGLKFFGSTDHQPSDISRGAERSNFANIKVIPNTVNGMRILKGIELNIGPNFAPFMKESNYLNRLDYGIASLHAYDFDPDSSNKELNTNYLIEACNCDFVKILGHIDDGHFDCDYHLVIEECVKTNTLLELNNSSISPSSFRQNSRENMITMISICKELNCPVVLNSDAHIKYDVGNVDLVYELCKEQGLSDELIANVNTDILKKYFINL